MTRLEDLYISLATFLIRYHDTQGVNPLIAGAEPIESRKMATSILYDTQKNFKERLEELISECTARYQDRVPFLNYILNELIVSKSLLDQKTPFTPEQCEKIIWQFTQFFTNIKNLLNTKKDKVLFIDYSTSVSSEGPAAPNRVTLYGLCNTTSYSLKKTLCNSGVLITDEIMKRFNLDTDTTSTEICALAGAICTEFQNSLLVPFLSAQAGAQTELQQTADNQLQQTPETEPQPAAETLHELSAARITELERAIAESKSSSAEELLQMQEKMSALNASVASLESTISSLKEENDQLKAEKDRLRASLNLLTPETTEVLRTVMRKPVGFFSKAPVVSALSTGVIITCSPGSSAGSSS